MGLLFQSRYLGEEPWVRVVSQVPALPQVPVLLDVDDIQLDHLRVCRPEQVRLWVPAL
jgi:hypothetical protein